MVPRVGQRIGPYEILGRLGSGGMGLVYSAWDSRLQRDVAIKILREEYATSTMRSRFLQEARAASGLNHPNICTVFDIGEIGGDPYLVMELLKGETLRARIGQRGKLAPEHICHVAAEVLDALVTAHNRGVIHRDIKPANIILVNKQDGGFQSKVLDFGLAKMDLGEDEPLRFDLTSVGTTVGTVSYMSPEQARGEALDARSDLFSLGSVLYEAATGDIPFKGATSALVFVELLGNPPDSVRQQNPDIPKDLEKFINRLLNKDAAERYQSAASALEALRSVSLRKSTFDNISRWAKGSAKQRSDSGRSTQAPPNDPSTGRSSDPVRTSSTVLRPARRIAEGGGPRSPLPGSELAPNQGTPLSASPIPEGFLQPVQRPSSGSPPMGSVVVRPVKPDNLRSLRYRDSPIPGETNTALLSNDGAPSSGSAIAAADSRGAEGPRSSTADIRSALQPALAEPERGSPSSSSRPRQIISTSRSGFTQTPSNVRDPLDRRRKPAEKPLRGLIILAVVVLLVALAWLYNSYRQSLAFRAPVTLVLVAGDNATADGTLPGVASSGLEFAMAQSAHLLVRSAQDYAIALRANGIPSGSAVSMDQARRAAQTIGANVLAFVDLRRDGPTYEITVRLIDASDGRRIDTHTETAPGRDVFAEALDRLSGAVRLALGGKPDDPDANPLRREASANMDALQAYANGASLELSGNPVDAILAYQRATALDPQFTQAYLRLASLYRSRQAEVAAASAATQAQAASSGDSARTRALTQAAYFIYASGEYAQAVAILENFLANRPNDLSALDQLALAQYLQGKFTETQTTVERALQLSRLDPTALQLQEQALIAQGRPEAVDGVENRAKAAGLTHPGLAAMADAAGSAPNETVVPGAETPLPTVVAANLLDAAGHFAEGAVRWQALGGYARSIPDQLSAAAFAEGSAGLNRALAGECNSALPAARLAQGLPASPKAMFNAAETQALCDDVDSARIGLATLQKTFGKHFAVQAYLGPELAATIAWKTGDTASALHILEGVRQYDSLTMSAYLRGLIELSSGQPQRSIMQFQAILSHRGPATLFAPETYPLSQLGVARAYALAGDTTNSSNAYGRFLEMWSSADSGLAALHEARSHAHL